MQKTVFRSLAVMMIVVLLLGCSIRLQAEQNTTQDTLPPGYYDTEEFFSWLRSETDLVTFFETERKIDGAFSDAYAGRLRELFEQDRIMFISTLAGCSADAQYRATLLLPGGYIGRQEVQSFHGEILLMMKDGTWSEQELEVLRDIESSANQILEMYLLDPTTEPPATEPSTEVTAPEETVPDTTQNTILPNETPDKPDNAVFWPVGLTVLVAAAALGLVLFMKNKRH